MDKGTIEVRFVYETIQRKCVTPTKRSERRRIYCLRVSVFDTSTQNKKILGSVLCKTININARDLGPLDTLGVRRRSINTRTPVERIGDEGKRKDILLMIPLYEY